MYRTTRRVALTAGDAMFYRRAKRILCEAELATSTRLLVASPSFLKRWGRPASLEELRRHKGIIYSYRGGADWRFRVAHKFTSV